MLRYLTLVRCVTYTDQDGDLMIKLNSFIFSKGGGRGGKSTQTNYLCSGAIELRFNTIINYLTHSCEAADVGDGSEMPPLCCHNPAAKNMHVLCKDQGWQNAFHPSSADSHPPQVCFVLQVPPRDKFRSKFNSNKMHPSSTKPTKSF